MNKENILEIDNLERSYSTVMPDGETKVYSVLRGISFQVKRGEFIGIMGSSGCGKTTLLKTIGMLNKPNGGKVLYNGEDTTEIYGDHLAEIRRTQLAFVFQDFYLMNSLTVRENIMMPSAAIINIFVLLICSFFVLSIKMECDFPEQKGKYIFYSQGGMTHRNIRKSIMKESFWTGGIPIIFGVVISTIFMGTEVYLKKLSLEWIKQYAVKLMGTITGIIFLFLFISICFGIRNIIRIEREE